MGVTLPTGPAAVPVAAQPRSGRRSRCRAWVGLGANLGDAAASLQAALDALASLPRTRLSGRSSIYRTAPVDAAGPDYLNAVAQIDTGLDAPELLAHLQAIEQRQGRERTFRNAPRTLDLDLLLYGDHIIATPELTVPHPRLHRRAFVLVPLSELAPGLALPGLGPIARWLPGVADQVIERLDAVTPERDLSRCRDGDGRTRIA